MSGEYTLIIIGILIIGFMVMILLITLIKGYKALKRAREVSKAKKCPYYIEGGLTNEEESKSR